MLLSFHTELVYIEVKARHGNLLITDPPGEEWGPKTVVLQDVKAQASHLWENQHTAMLSQNHQKTNPSPRV